MSTTFKAACVQLNAGREIAPNVETASALIREARAAGAEFIALPENATLIEPDNEAALQKAWPEAEHPGLPVFQDLARETGAWLLIGSLTIRLDDGKLANRSLLLDSSGGIVSRYDKLHLFDVNLKGGETYRESDTIRHGGEAVAAPTPWGLLGMTICYDVRFAYLYRALAQAGAVVLSVPAAFTRTTGRAHWHVLLRARAIETGCYVIAPAQCGTHAEGRKTYGHSLIIDPWGEIIAEAAEEEGIIVAEIDPERVAQARRRIPQLEHDRAFAGPGLAAVKGRAAEG
jgi:predicted amidohydrolase